MDLALYRFLFTCYDAACQRLLVLDPAFGEVVFDVALERRECAALLGGVAHVLVTLLVQKHEAGASPADLNTSVN